MSNQGVATGKIIEKSPVKNISNPDVKPIFAPPIFKNPSGYYHV
jgi:hypothetical protein